MTAQQALLTLAALLLIAIPGCGGVDKSVEIPDQPAPPPTIAPESTEVTAPLSPKKR
jgi:hypothetical protein